VSRMVFNALILESY